MSPPILTLRELNRATLARQGLLAPLKAAPVARLVERVGSLQAQHPDWPPLALQSRLPVQRAPVDVARARARKTIVRGSLMRMTVHVVSAADYWPMSTLTHPFRFDQWRLVFKRDPVTSPLGKRIGQGHAAVLAAMAERPLAIHEIEAILRAEMGRTEIPPNRPLWRHFSGTVPLIQVPHAEERYGRARYLPAVEWLGAPRPDEADPDQAAAHLTRRYFAAFGPASVEDLVAYVGRGRNLGQWRAVVKAMAGELVEFVDEQGRTLLDLPDAPRPEPDTPARPRLLARWDGLLLAHETRHRGRVLPAAHQATVITKNADVLPTFLLDGVVAGTWLPMRAPDGATRLDLRPFGQLRAADREALEAEGSRLLPLLGRSAYDRYPGTD
jgi:Winged helix DNA-binding domain